MTRTGLTVDGKLVSEIELLALSPKEACKALARANARIMNMEVSEDSIDLICTLRTLREERNGNEISTAPE
jgi:hypothetical protein